MAAAAYGDGRRVPWALLSPEGTYYKLREPSFFVGRNGDVDLTLESRSVDKKHAVITIQGGQELHYIHDLDSLNGTFVNERRVQKSKLGLGDTVRFGYDMNTYCIDLYPHEDNKIALFDENHNYNNCYKGCNDMNHHIQEPKMCYMPKTGHPVKESTPDAVVHGSKLYGQPSWWGWGSSDEEIYTYPNCATVVSQSGTTQCTVLQQRIKRNKSNIEQHYTSLKKPATTKTTRTPTSPATSVLTTRNVQEFSNIYNIPMFGAWESVPHGSYVEGLEEDSLDNDSYYSKDSLSFIPIVPDFGELPEKPVSEKSRKTQKVPQLDSSPSSSFSENSDFDYNHRGGVFGLTEVKSPNSKTPKGVRAGKPKHQPAIKIKTNEPKSNTPRNEKSRAPLRRNSSASSVTKESPSRPSRDLNRASSSGGSSIPSDSESRESGQTPVTSTSDDSNGEHTGNSDDKRKTEKTKSLSPREVYSADVTDKGNRSSSLPRVNKTALLRARNSREAIKTSARRSSPLRSRITAKSRHRRSTPSKDSKSTDPSSLRIWSPSNKNPTKPHLQEKNSTSAESSVSSSVSSSSMGDGAQEAAVDAIFQAGTPGSYTLPQDLQMNRNDSNNRTFVLEDKDKKDDKDTSTSDVDKTPDSSTTNHKWISSMEDTLETLHLSFGQNENTTKLSDVLQANRPLTRPLQTDDWMTTLSNNGRSTSPESFVSVPPVSSPSPPSTPRSTARHLIQERTNCSSAPPQAHARRQWDITEKPVEDLMLSSVHAFTVELRLASELVLSKARNLYETSYAKDTEHLSDKGYSNTRQDSKIPEWKSSHAEIAGVFRNLRRVEFNLRTMDQALSYLCSEGQDCQDGHKISLPNRSGLTPKKWNEIQARARKFSWAEENRCKFPGPPSDDEEVAT